MQPSGQHISEFRLAIYTTRPRSDCHTNLTVTNNVTATLQKRNGEYKYSDIYEQRILFSFFFLAHCENLSVEPLHIRLSFSTT